MCRKANSGTSWTHKKTGFVFFKKNGLKNAIREKKAQEPCYSPTRIVLSGDALNPTKTRSRKKPSKTRLKQKSRSFHASYSTKQEQSDRPFEPELHEPKKQTETDSPRQAFEPDPNKRKKRVAGRPIPEYYY